MLPKLSIAIPFYNEEKSIEKVVTSIINEFDEIGDCELILVNNGSSDKTPQLVNYFDNTHKNIKAVHIQRNAGYGYGVICGLKVCTGEIIGYIDGDEQTSSKSITKVYKKLIDNNLDICKGTRVIRKDGLSRFIASKAYNFLIILLFGYKIRDINGKPKIMKKHCLEILNLKSKDWFLDTEILLMAQKNRLKVGDIPLIFNKRKRGSSSINLGTVIEFLKNILKVRFQLWKNHQ